MTNTNEQELQIYEVTNRTTGNTSYQPATNAEDACKQAGWLIGDCYVSIHKPRYKPIPDHEGLNLVKLPCLTCPYQYAECQKPPALDCPVRPQAPDIQEWLKQATKTRLCPFVGETLTKKDHNLGQKWIPIEQAIKELTPDPTSPPPQRPPGHLQKYPRCLYSLTAQGGRPLYVMSTRATLRGSPSSYLRKAPTPHLGRN